MRCFFALLALALICFGCAQESKPVTVFQRGKSHQTNTTVYNAGQKNAKVTANKTAASSASASASIASMGYSIQVGAFSLPENAAALTSKLDGQGLDPYFFREKSGHYKVRFGNFKTMEGAQKYAETLLTKKIISEYYIVKPSEYAATQVSKKGVNYLRDELVKSAEKYIGVPYKWGGTGSGGFDCSGLTQAVYSLNGLSVPRNSAAQYSQGSPVAKNKLLKGDMVFFATDGSGRVSHVGIYIGGGEFIHAPSKGKTVCVEKLSNPYFLKTYAGARCYV